MPKIYIKNREKLIICGLFLSKFDKNALNILNFSSFTHAFNALGYALGGKPMSIKNYRDEFDPYFENSRKGWNDRDLRDYCRAIYDEYKDLSLGDFADLINGFLDPNFELQRVVNRDLNIEAFNPKRLVTGLAAEEFFIKNYQKHFDKYSLIDTRILGCGFDFKLDYKSDFFAVEVKGLNENRGNFLLTQKEFEVAKRLNDNYCLFIVKNFKEKPTEELIFNPLKKLELKEIRQEMVMVNYQGKV